MRLFITVIFSLLANYFAWAQMPFGTKLFAVEDGLPNLEVFGICQDAKGYIWIGSSRGLTRFDGQEFDTLSLKDGLKYASVLPVFTDNYNRLWFCSYYGDIQYLENGKIKDYPHQKILQTVRKKSIIEKVYRDGKGNTYFTYFRGIVVKINDKTGEYKVISSIRYSKSTITLWKEDGKLLWDFNDDNLTNVKLNGQTEIKLENGKYTILFSYPERPNTFHSNVLTLGNSEYLISFGRKIIHIKGTTIISEKIFETDIIDIILDKENRLWMSLNQKGVLVYPKADLSLQPEYVLDNISPGSLLNDFENNIWVTCRGRGVFLIPNLKFPIINFPQSDYSPIEYISVQKNKILFFNDRNRFFFAEMIENELINKKSFLLKNVNQQWISCVFLSTDNTIWLGGTMLIHLTLNGQVIKKYEKTVKVLCIKEDANNTYILRRGYLSVIEKKTNIIKDYLITTHQGVKENIFADNILIEENGKILIGTEKGIFQFENNTLTQFQHKYPILAERVKKIIKFKNYYAVATNYGVFIWNNKQCKIFNENSQLSSSSINTICADEKNSKIYAATDKGLCTISIKDTLLSKAEIQTYSDADGIPVNTISDLILNQNILWVATSKGLVRIATENLKKNTQLPRFFYNYTLVNDTIKRFDTCFVLESDQNKLEFHFLNFYYRRNEKLYLRYSFDNFRKQYTATKNNYIRLAGLKPGEYCIYIQAGLDGFWKQDTMKIRFIIKEPFTKTWTFFWLIILITIFIVLSLGMLYYKQKKNRMLLRQKLLYAEQVSLQAQMNPHFLFNSMNSLQRYIYESNPEEASNLIVNLSDLMRLTFENSVKNLIPLSQEIELIRKYLEIERIRFNSGLIFEIEVENSTISAVKLPPLILQPIVENVIWHHLTAKKEEKKIYIKIIINDYNYLICTIKDNGIGLDEALKINNKRSTISISGLKKTIERIKILNEFYKIKIELNNSDRYIYGVLEGSVSVITIPLYNFKNTDINNI